METLELNMNDRFKQAIDILYLAKQHGIKIDLNNDQLQLKLPENEHIDENLLEQIKINKQLIIQYLSDNNWKSKTVTQNHNRINKFNRDSFQRIPLSFSQERLWFIDQREGSLQYHSSDVLRLNGRINGEALQFALQVIANRHEVLRTVVREEHGETFQYVKQEDTFKLNKIDGSHYLNDKKGLQQFIDSLINQPFNLSQDDMMRVHLITLTDDEHLLVVIVHHIASDGWSRSILMSELAELYAAYIEDRPAKLLSLELQYSDYASWQRQNLQGELLDKQITYWKQKLDGVTSLQIPTDYPRPAVHNPKGTSISFSIDKQLTEQLQQLNAEQGVTLYMTLLAALKVLLYRYTGQHDICVGTSIADRPHEVEELIGFFVNTVVLRTNVKGDASFKQLLQQVKNTTLEAYQNQEVPFEKVVEAVIKERDISRHPLFQVMLVLSNSLQVPQLQLGNVIASRELVAHNSSKFDFTFFITETPLGLEGTVAYSTDLFSEETITRMIRHYKQLLSSLVKTASQQVGKLRILSPAEEQELLTDFNAAIVNYPNDKSVVTLFEEQVIKAQDAIAIVFEKEQLTYGKLNEKANQLAHYLQKQGVKKETLVPLCIEPGPPMIIAIMGILKAGAAYVPIDPEFPQERISYMLKDTQSRVVISTKQNSRKFENDSKVDIINLDELWPLISKEKTGNPAAVSADSLAYVIYTSGSTGAPKGVMIEHKNLVDYVYGLQQTIQINECSSFALVSSIATDLGNTVLYSSLIFGGTLHLFSKQSINDSDIINSYFNEHLIDCLKIVPSHWKALSNQEKLLLPGRLLIFGGEALHPDVVKNIQFSTTTCTIVNHYGPTETTVGKLLHIVQPGKKYNATIPIGKPFSNTQVYILSKDLELCPIGVPGELYIGGDGLARGYANQTDLTNNKFIQNPFNKQRSLLYRTGDLVKYLTDGNIEFRGRIDEQVKIRGYRIELGEIESILQQSALVSASAVVAEEDSNGNKRLVCYIVPEGFFDQEEIVSYLKRKLPEYMIPVQWIELENMPLMANGKINRKALPDPDDIEKNRDEYVAPRNVMEEKLATIWQQLLEVEKISVHDNFFELGGHSLLAIQLISNIRKQLEVNVSIGDIFDFPTINLLAAQFKNISTGETFPIIIKQQRPSSIPLSFNQERLWFIDQMEGSVHYHRPDVLRLKGEINKDALCFALQMIVNRHEVLRTVIHKHDGIPYQFIKDQDKFKLNSIDGSHYHNDPEGLKLYIEKLIEEPFDLSKDDMLRAHLIVLHEQEHVLVLTMHHIAFDGWSISVFVKEFTELYKSFKEDRPAQLNIPEIQYVDYALWQLQNLNEEILNKKTWYWQKKLNGLTPLQLPTDYPRPAIQSTKGATYVFTINKELTLLLQKLSHQHGTTMFMTLLASFKVLLQRYSYQKDICVGCPVAGRQQQDIEKLIGFFVNTLALRSEVNVDASFIELLQQVRATTLEAYEHQDVPFEKVVNALVKERDISRNPIFQVMFDFGTALMTSMLQLGDIEISSEEFVHNTSKFDLTLNIAETANGLKGFVEYSTDLFTRETIERMMVHYQELLSSIVKDPSQKLGILRMLTPAEEQQLLNEFTNTTTPYPKDKTIVHLFEEQVTKTPNSIAVVFENEQLTYDQLNERSNQLSDSLKSLGVREDTLVPICIERSIDMIVAILGILKAGGAYVPIDPEYPLERINHMLEDTEARIIISTISFRELFRDVTKSKHLLYLDNMTGTLSLSYPDKPCPAKANSLAYVIYTSGSTGNPKGVLVTHRNVVSLVRGVDYVPLSNENILLSTGSSSFDATTFEYWSTLLNGGRLIFSREDKLLNIEALKKEIEKREVNIMWFTSSWFNSIVDTDVTVFGRLKTILVGGEKLSEKHIYKVKQTYPSIRLINGYGPTENTTFSLTYNITETGNTIPIGYPLNNRSAYLLNEQLQLVPIGAAGEIYLSGAGLSRGYLNRPDLTSVKFISNPFTKEDGAKMYKTGDIGRWRSDGNLEYLGRRDEQVKIHGYRIELGEIESALQQNDLIRRAVVISWVDNGGNKKLVAYVVAEGFFDKEDIEYYLKGKLPAYMIPNIWVELNSLPITRNGKVDKKALPEPSISGQMIDRYEAPHNEQQMALAKIWKELLHMEKVSIHDSFFRLGGHSLLGMRLISLMRKELNLELSIKELFQYNTIMDLDKYLEIQAKAGSKETDLREYEFLNI